VAEHSSVEPKRLTLDELVITQLRNIQRVSINPAPRINVITGNNGEGKTSILEAIYLLATTRSFRTSRLAEVVRHNETIGSVRGRLAEHWPGGPISREQTVGIDNGKRRCRLNGEAPSSTSHYATRSPVVVFEPQQMTLSMGPASERRTLLDRVTMYTQPETAGHRTRYGRALRGRQRLLSDRWPQLADSAELDAYEALMSEHGCALTRARQQATMKLTVELAHAFERIAAPELSLGASYQPGGSEEPTEAASRLREDREKDCRRKRTAFGPHLDDLSLTIDGHPARIVASQGQHRAITLALKAAELACISEARGLMPLLLLDDVSSELDADRSAALFDYLATTESQIFLTTTRRDLIVTERAQGSDRRDFHVEQGSVREA
jgi:DNA replication and repair protein RecF